MDAAALTLAFAGIRNWVATLRGDTPLERQVVLPNDQVRVVYRFKIVGASAGTSDDPGHAQLTPRRGPVPASLSWAISAGDRQMAGVLPDGGQVAMWIREARFFVEGATPNSKGNVIVAVSTSGTCENGFGAKRSHRFVAKAMVGNYAYHVRTEEVYNPWSIDAEVYARPTPFTQWHMVFDADGGDPADAGWLRMELTIAYRRAGPAHG